MGMYNDDGQIFHLGLSSDNCYGSGLRNCRIGHFMIHKTFFMNNDVTCFHIQETVADVR